MFLTFYSYFLAALFSGTSAFESSVNGDRSASSVQWRSPVVVAGASGYIGRAVVQELVSRGVPTAALVRSPSDLSDITRECLEGSSLVQCNSLDPVAVAQVYAALQPSVTVCCLASRNGLGADSFAVDYNGGHNLLRASLPTSHYVLLSAYCVGKPELQFQLAKLKLEAEIRAAAKMQRISHSIVRPTAYFKSLDGQIEAARAGSPVFYFGDGTCSANPICEKDLAAFVADCALQPREVGMLDSTRNIGGPDVPPLTKREQIDLLYDALKIPLSQRRAISIPVALLSGFIGAAAVAARFFGAVGAQDLRGKAADIAEIIRIIRYYATEPMVAVGAGEVFGETGLGAHFNRLAARGGQLAERDQFTTTTGVLDLVLKDSYSSYSVEELVSTDDDMFTKSSDVSDGNRTPREESVVV